MSLAAAMALATLTAVPAGTIGAQTSPDPTSDDPTVEESAPAGDTADTRPNDEAIPGGNRAVVTTTQARFVDTRPGGTTLDGQFQGEGRRAADSEYKVTIAGRGDVPANAPGVVMYVTAIFPDDVGFVTIHPCLTPRPVVSSLNYTGGVTVGNEVVAGLAADGSVCIYTSEGADLTVDVGGFLPVGGNGITIASGGRVLETREGATTVDGQSQGIGRTTAGSTTKVRLAGRAGIPPAVDGVVVNVAALDPTDTGFVEVHACETPLPVASKINYSPGVNRANELISGVDANGDICIFTEHDLDLIVDAVAFIPSLTNFVPVPHARLLETRPGAPTIDGLNQGEGIRAADSEYTLKVTERAGIPANAIAIVANVTGVDPTGIGFATVHPCLATRPNTASLNYTAAVNGANQIIAPLNAAGELCIYTLQAMHLLLDVSGYLLPTANLSITKTDSVDPVVAGRQLTYTITVANAGPDAATDVVVTDTLPAGVTFVSTTGCDNDATGVPTCNLGTIAAGASKQYTVTVTVDAPTAGTITNTASVASSVDDPDATNNATTEDTLVQQPGTINIVKATAPAGETGFGFTDTIAAPNAFTLDDGQTKTFTDVTPGSYTVTENDPTPTADLTGLSCDDGASTTPSSVSLATRTATINVEPGETVTCTYTNTKRGTINIVKASTPAGGTGFGFTGNIGMANVFSLDDGQTQTFTNVVPGTYTVTEDDPTPGFDLTALACVDSDASGTASTTALATRVSTINLDPGETVTCTYGNTQRATVTIIKDEVPDLGTDYGFTGSFGAFSLDDDTDAALPNARTFLNVTPGVLTVTENDPTPGADLTSLVCVDSNGAGTPSTGDVGTRTATINLDAGESVTCTFTNTVRGTINVVKGTAPAGGSGFGFTDNIAAPNNFTLDDGQTQTFTNVVPGSYTVTEDDPVPNAHDLTGLVCVDSDASGTASTTTLATRASTINLDPGETVTCTYTNTRRGAIFIEKQTAGGDATFGFTSTIPTGAAFSVTTAAGIGNQQFFSVPAGTYTVTENDPTPTYDLTALTCNDGASATPSTTDVGTRTATINLDPAEVVTCSFTNTKRGTINIVKNAVPDGPQDFGFTSPGLTPATFDLDDDADATLSNTQTFNDVLPGTYTVTENDPTPGFDLTGLTCDDGASTTPSTTNLGTRAATINLDPGETVTCTYTNTQRGTIRIIKSSTPSGGTGFGYTDDIPGSGSFTLNDGGTETIANVVPGTYTVTENDPTPGYDLTSLACVDSVATGTASTTVLATRVSTINLDPGETVTCSYGNVQRGTIVVEKQTLPDGDPQNFAFTGTAAGAIGDGGQIVVNDLMPGAYNAVETVPVGWDLTDITCNDANSTGNTGTATANFVLDPGETVTCTFTNTKRGTIVVEKQTLPDGSPQSFTFTGNAAGSITDGQTITVSDLVPGSYSSVETVPAGWDLTDITCNDANSTGNTGTATANFVLDPGETVTCTFTNTEQSTITVVKDFVGTAGLVNLQIDGATAGGATDVGDGGTTGAVVVATGNRTAGETAGTGTDLSLYNSAYSCTEDSNPASPVAGPGITSANIPVAPGDVWTCTFTNTRKTGTIEVVKDFVGTAGTVDLQIDGVTQAANQGDGGTTGAVTVDTGNHTAGEIAAGATNLADYNTTHSCIEDSNPASPINAAGITTGTIPVEEGDVWVCTFTNTRKTGTIEVVKDFVGTAGTVDLQIDGVTQAANQGDGGTTGAVTADTGNHTAGEIAAGATNLADYNTTYSCIEDTSAASPINGTGTTTISIPVAEGDVWVCTFTNTELGTIDIVKNTDPDGPQDFGFTASAGLTPGTFSLDDDTDGTLSNTRTFNGVVPGTHTVTEAAVAGFDLTDLTCVDSVGGGTASTGNTGTRVATINLDPGETVTCTFTNTQRGSIDIVKNTDPDGPQDFGFSAPALVPTTFSLDDDADGTLPNTQMFTNVVPGAYVVTEGAVAGFDVSALTCVDSDATGTASTGNTVTRAATINLDPGETVTCTFTNTQRGSIVIVKDAVPNDAQDFAFTASAGLAPTNFTLDDDAGAAGEDATFANTQTFNNVVPNTYTVVESDPSPANVSAIDCVDTDAGGTASTGNTGTRTATINLDPGETVTCTFTNSFNDAPTINAPSATTPFALNSAENQTSVTDVTATDDNDTEGGGGLTYSKTTTGGGGADNGYFDVDANTGVVTWMTAPDFETMADDDADGTYLLQVTVTDSGPGTPLTDVIDLQVTVTNVNDAPVVTPSAGTTAFVEDAGAVTVDASITVVDQDGGNLASATVTIVNQLDGTAETLACAGCPVGITPVYTPGTGVLTLTGPDTIANFQTAFQSVTYDNSDDTPNTTDRTVRFVANDGTVNSNNGDKTVSVAATNDPPNAVNDLYTQIPVNVVLDAGTGAPGIDIDLTDGVLTQGTDDSDPEGAAVTVSAIVGCADITAPFANCPTTGGGTVTMNANGTFTYLSQAGEDAATDTFTYTVSDGSGGNDNGLVTIQFGTDTIWFVDDPGGAPGGSGRSNDPFRTVGDLNTANAAGGTNDPANGDIVYVQTGTHNDAGFNLRATQQLIGEGVALNSGLLSIPAGTRPTVSPAGNGVNLGAGNTVRGLNIGNTAGTGINGTAVAGLTVNNVAITATGTGGGIDIASGSNGSVTLDSITTQGGDGIRVTNIGGTQTFAVTGATDINNPTGDGIDIGGSDGTTFTFSTIDIDGGTANGIDIDGGVGSFTVSTSTQIDGQAGDGIEISNSTTDTFSFGATDIGQSNSAGSNDGIDLLTSNANATFTFASLDITNANGVGIRSGPGTVNLGGATNTVSSTGGAALQSNGTNLGAGWNFTSLTSTNSALDGINLEGINQSVTVSGLVDINSPADQGIEIINSGGNVSINTDNTANEGLEIDEAGDHSIRLNGNTGTFTVRRGHARNDGVLNNHAEDGIEITNVTGAVSISGASGDLFEIRDHADNTAGGGADGRHAVIADNSGNVTLDFIHIFNHGDFGADLNLEHGVYWFQPRDNAQLTVTNSTIETVNDGNGIRLENDISLPNPSTSGTLTAVIQGNTIRGDSITAGANGSFNSTEFGIETQFRGGANVDVTIGHPTDTSLDNTLFDLDDGIFVFVNGAVGSSGSPAKIRIDGNDMSEFLVDAIDVEIGDTADVGQTFVDLFIRGNDIDNGQVSGHPNSAQGIVVEWLDDDGGVTRGRITDNQIDNVHDEAIFLLSVDIFPNTGIGDAIMLLDNNDIGLSGTGSVRDEGIRVRNRGDGNLDLTTINNDSRNNNDQGIFISTDFTSSGDICLNPGVGGGNNGTGNGDPDYDLGQSSGTNIFIQGLSPNPSTDVQTETYLGTLNSTVMDAVSAGNSFSASAGACQTPPAS